MKKCSESSPGAGGGVGDFGWITGKMPVPDLELLVGLALHFAPPGFAVLFAIIHATYELLNAPIEESVLSYHRRSQHVGSLSAVVRY